MSFNERDRLRLIQVQHMLVSVLQNQNLGATRMSALSDAIADLQTKVEADTTVDQSAITLLGGLTSMIQALKDQVAQAADVPAAVAAIQAFKSQLENNQATLSAAVVANTPSA